MGAVDALEGEGKAGMAADIFQQAVGNQVTARQTVSQRITRLISCGMPWTPPLDEVTWSSHSCLVRKQEALLTRLSSTRCNTAESGSVCPEGRLPCTRSCGGRHGRMRCACSCGGRRRATTSARPAARPRRTSPPSSSGYSPRTLAKPGLATRLRP